MVFSAEMRGYDKPEVEVENGKRRAEEGRQKKEG